MTLHISAIVGGSAYQVSDRLASVNADPWDTTWNKTIVFRTMDALVAIGLTGPAFVGRRPIDEWMAEVLFDGKIPSGTMFTGRPGGMLRRGLTASLRKVESGLREAVITGLLPPRDRVGASIVGWRIQGRRVRVCALTLEWDPGGRPFFQRKTRRVHSFAGLGANPSSWVTLARLEALRLSVEAVSSDTEREDLMIQYLREVSRAGHPVGPDAMCVRISVKRPFPRIRFAPGDAIAGDFAHDDSGSTYSAPVIYTPAIVTPSCAQLACVATGPPAENLDGFRIDWDLPRMPPPQIGKEGGVDWRIEGQPRKPRP